MCNHHNIGAQLLSTYRNTRIMPLDFILMARRIQNTHDKIMIGNNIA